MKIDVSISVEAKEHIAMLRIGQDLLYAVLVWGRFDFESHDYYNLAFVNEDQIDSEWPYFKVGDLKVSIGRKEIAEAIAGKNIVISKGEFSFE